MYSGKKYKLARNYKYAKQLKKSRELNERLKVEEEKKLWKERERLLKEELEQKRKIAIEKGYMLSQDYKGDLYDIQYFCNNLKGLSALEDYGTMQNLLKEYSLDITSAKFNKALKSFNFVIKELSLNQNNWILKGDGLNYGINLIKFSRYMHIDTPDWYKVHIFDSKKMELRNLDSSINIKMTSVLFKKDKFNELYQLVIEQIKYR